MDPTDFDFDMGRDDDYTRIEERAYPAFRSGEDCEEDVEMARLLDRGEVVASSYLYAGPSLIQFLTFEQAIIQFSTSGPPISALELIRSGHDNPGCEFSGDNLRTRNFGLEDGSEAFEVIGNDSLVHNQDTIFDSLVLDTTVRDVSVWIAQGDFLFITSAAVDTELAGGVSYRELYRAVEESVEKAYGQ